MTSGKLTALRGPMLTFTGNPFKKPAAECIRHETDGLIVIQDGKIKDCGSYSKVSPTLPKDVPITKYPPHFLIMPGFIDAHAHYPQTEMVGAYGEDLLAWLNKYTFVIEQKFRDTFYARAVADLFLSTCLSYGTTTVASFCTVYPESVNAFFEASKARNMRNIGGKVMMDRHAAKALLDTPQEGYEESKRLLEKWHGNGRQLYAVTPRFAPTSTPEQLEAAGALVKENPGVYVQTHLSENPGEVAWVADLFRDHRCSDYLGVYERFGLVGARSLFGHGIHLTPREWSRLSETGAVIVHCPTSNEFLGSGRFDLKKAVANSVRIALGTDIGAGTSFSILDTLKTAYGVAQNQGQYALSGVCGLYLATQGAAEALSLGQKIGSIEFDREADLVVLDTRATPLLDLRTQRCDSLEELLFTLMILGGSERAVHATYVAGQKVYEKNSRVA